jgi:hypothetical protein
MSKHRPPVEPPDPVPEYRDWIDHRYTPGYFVGGRLSPSTKRLQEVVRESHGGGRTFGVVCLIVAAATIATGGYHIYLTGLREIHNVLLGMLFALVPLVAGVSALRRARRP